MTGRSDIVALARSWIGTPYRHQASVRGAGADCLGLVRGIWAEAVGPLPETIQGYSRNWGEAGDVELLWEGAGRYLQERDGGSPMPGDVLLFRMRNNAIAKHLGILASTGQEKSFVHSYARHGVVESRLSEPWASRLVASFAFPERLF